MEIKFKNGSEIRTIDTKEENGRSKVKEFQCVDISRYIEYLKKYPSKFLELQNIKLHWWQKIWIDKVTNKYNTNNKDIKQ